jgi:ATP-dependent Clp protease adaptor protein ClpS
MRAIFIGAPFSFGFLAAIGYLDDYPKRVPSQQGGHAMNDDAVFAGTTTKPIEREETKTRRLPPYNVILENDDYHSMEFVMSVLQKALAYTEQKAYQLMMLAHTSGEAVVWTGSKEVAELKMEQMQSLHEIAQNGKKLGPLAVRIEPTPG